MQVLLFFHFADIVMAAVAVGKVGMAHKANMPREVGIRLRVGHAENLAQRANAVEVEHLRIHAAADAVGHTVRVRLKRIERDAAVLQAAIVVGKVPFAHDCPSKRQAVDDFFQADKRLAHRKS